MKTLNYLPSVILVFLLLGLWQVFSLTGLISPNILPSPFAVAKALTDNFDTITQHSLQTLLEAIIGLVIATGLGLLTAVLLDMSSFVRKAVYPVLLTSQTIPMIALAPLLLLWFGFDMSPKIIIVVLSCFFPIAVATVDGFAKTDKSLIKLFKSMDADYFQILFKVKLPGSLPQFFSGLKIAATYSVTGAIVGEYVGAYQGLGIYMQEMAHAHAINVLFATIFVTAILTIMLFIIVGVLEKILLPWYKKN